jgi:hypothetical protein
VGLALKHHPISRPDLHETAPIGVVLCEQIDLTLLIRPIRLVANFVFGSIGEPNDSQGFEDFFENFDI